MSTGEDNKMTISEQAFLQIQQVNLNVYRFNLREVEAKGKGTMVTYQVFKNNSNVGKNSPGNNNNMIIVGN